MATLFRKGPFAGPNYVNGLADQTNAIQITSSTKAVLEPFPGGFDDSITYTTTYYGTGFGLTEDGRYTGTVTRFVVEASDGSSWHVYGYDAPLNTVNTAVTEQDFIETLLVPIKWNYVGNNFSDNFIGGSFGDTLIGFGGDDTFQGLGGDDLIFGGSGNDDLNGEDDNDTIFGGRDDDIIRGGPGSDRLLGQHGNDEIYGGEGPDDISGGRGNDYVEGGDQGDSILGMRGNDELYGQNGGDTVDGGSGSDFVDGGDGTDIVLGGPGNDTVQGGTGSDFITGGFGNDILAANTASEVEYDMALDSFIFEGRFGNDVITDFEIDWDSIRLLNIDEDDVTVTNVNDDVLIEVSNGFFGSSSILVQGVAGEFDPNVDIVYADNDTGASDGPGFSSGPGRGLSSIFGFDWMDLFSA